MSPCRSFRGSAVALGLCAWVACPSPSTLDDDDTTDADDDDAVGDDARVEVLRRHLDAFLEASELELAFGLTDATPVSEGGSAADAADAIVASFHVVEPILDVDGTTVPGPIVRLSGAGAEDFARQALDPRLDPSALLVTVLWSADGEEVTNTAVVSGEPSSGDLRSIFEPLSTFWRLPVIESGDASIRVVGRGAWGDDLGSMTASVACIEGGGCAPQAVTESALAECDAASSVAARCEDGGCGMATSLLGWCGRPVVDTTDGVLHVREGTFGVAWSAVDIELSSSCDCGVPPQDLDGDGFTPAEGDCDDGDPARHPGAAEACDVVDSNCDGDLVDGFADLDGDGLPDCVDDDADGDGFRVIEGDCDDMDAAFHPGAPEVCDLLDSDCDGDLSDGETDLDADGLPDCIDDDIDGDGFTVAEGDCDDLDAAFAPGAGELCDLLDSDCDGEVVDEFPDLDGDGVPDCVDTDADGDGYTPDQGDCDDTDATVSPAAVEVCDAVDSDCDGDLVDGDSDLDLDGIPDCADTDVDGDGWTSDLDCVDTDPAVNPGATEICFDGIDQDCVGGGAAPVANAGPSVVASRSVSCFRDAYGNVVGCQTCEATHTLDGTASSDPEGGALAWAWTQVEGPQVSLSDPASAAPSATFFRPMSAPGTATTTWRFELVVTDCDDLAGPPETTTFSLQCTAL